MFDIDEFKKFNDHYGHPEADLAMGSLVRATQDTIRRSDSLYRFGGEEFVVTLPEGNGEGALVGAERIPRPSGSAPWWRLCRYLTSFRCTES